MSQLITLEDRELVDVNVPAWVPHKYFGVSLDNEEAQDYLQLGLRVGGDKEGPYLLIRVHERQTRPLIDLVQKADVTFKPEPWQYYGGSGVICWLEKIN